MPNKRRSAIVDLLANIDKPLSTRAIAEHLRIRMDLTCTRVRQLEENGRIRRVGTATRVRDIRWEPVDPTVGKRPREQISYRAAENIEAMRTALVERLQRGLPADWVCEPDEVMA